MNKAKQPLTIAITLALGVGSTTLTQAAQLDLNFTNNATPGANPLSSSVGAFAANTEFRIVTPYGTAINAGQHDVMSGGESWTFSGANLVGAVMAGVGGTDTNTGASSSAPITSGQAGFPVCGTAGTCATIQQNFDFLGANTLSFIAPIAGSPAGNAYGEAVVQKFNPGDTGNDIEILFPVLQFQWLDGNYLLGSDPLRGPVSPDGSFTKGAGPGLLFFGEADGSGGFALWAEYETVGSEGAVIALVDHQHYEWELVGSYSTSAVPLPASAWLFGSGLAGLAGLSRRRRKSA